MTAAVQIALGIVIAIGPFSAPAFGQVSQPVEGCRASDNVVSALIELSGGDPEKTSPLGLQLWHEWLSEHGLHDKPGRDRVEICSTAGRSLVTFSADPDAHLVMEGSRPLLMRTRSGYFVFRSAVLREDPDAELLGADLSATASLRRNSKGRLIYEYRSPTTGATFVDVGSEGNLIASSPSSGGSRKRARVGNRLCPVVFGCAVCPQDSLVTSSPVLEGHGDAGICDVLESLLVEMK